MFRRLLKDVAFPIAVAIALALVIQASIAKPYEIPTGSMYPTIQPNDRIIANRLIYRFRDIQRGDIIVFEPPLSAKRTCAEPTGSDVPFVKRVIGLPGDKVEIKANGPTLVNGKPLAIENAGPNPENKTFPRVPAKSLLVLGDNRPNSCDSHQWQPDPFVPEDNVIGQAEVTYWPLGHIKFL